jgi:hypothetical protein
MALTVLLATSACGTSGSLIGAVVGKWKLAGVSKDGQSEGVGSTRGMADIRLQFYKNETVTLNINDPNGKNRESIGSYNFVDDKHMRIDMPGRSPGGDGRIAGTAGSAIYETTMSGNRLSLKGTDGITWIYEKAD